MEIDYLLYLLEATVCTIILGMVSIPLLKKYKARQAIREEGPKSHRVKAGTPTMGGLFLVLSGVIVILGNGLIDKTVLWLLFLMIGHGTVSYTHLTLPTTERV